MSDTVSIRITADTSGVEAGIQQVRGDLGELKSTVQAAADSMSGGFAGMRGAVERGAQSMDALTASMRGLRPQEIVSGLNEVTAALKHNSVALQEIATRPRTPPFRHPNSTDRYPPGSATTRCGNVRTLPDECPGTGEFSARKLRDAVSVERKFG